MSEQDFTPEQEAVMTIIAIHLESLTDGDLAQYGRDCARYFADDVAAGMIHEAASDSLMGSLIHREMIRRDMDLDAVDFFNRMNAVKAILPPDMTYSEYVAGLRGN